MSDIQPALTQSEVLEEEYLELRGSLPEGYVQQRDLILREFGNDRHKGDERILLAFRNALNDESKQPPLTAVALSGGGIRSATFALGVLQALAKRTPVLRQLDYLSTVSGGGYLGSWLTAWIHRNQNGRDGVMDQLSGDAGIENIPLNPRRGPSE